MKLTEHIGRIVRTGAVDVSVTWGEPIPYDGAIDRKLLARQLELAIRTSTIAALRGSAAA